MQLEIKCRLLSNVILEYILLVIAVVLYKYCKIVK